MKKALLYIMMGLQAFSYISYAQSDTASPTVTITSTESSPTPNTSIPININFSEAIIDFTAEDISVSTGSLASLTPVLEYRKTIGSWGSGNNQFTNPHGVAVDVFGKIYVADTYNHRIQIFNTDYSYAATLGTGTSGNGNNQFNRPSSIAIDGSGKIYIADTYNHRIQIFNPDFSYASTLGTGIAGIGNHQLSHPKGVTIDTTGKIYIADYSNHRIQIFNTDYSYAATIGTGVQGAGNDEFDYPSGIAVDASNKIYVADRGNHRIQIFDVDYSYSSTLGTGASGSDNNQFAYPNNLAVDSTGTIYILDANNQRVQIFNSDHNYKGTIGKGIQGSGNDQFKYPQGIGVDRLGGVYVADNNNHRIQIFTAHTYHATLSSYSEGEITVDIAADVVTDAAGNSNAAATQFTIFYDAPPTVAIQDSPAIVKSLDPYTVRIAFSEAVTGFELSDLTIGNGSASNLVAVDASTYDIDITPNGRGYMTIDVMANAAVDVVGNDNTAADQIKVLYDGPPSVAIQDAPAIVKSIDPYTVQIVFSEAVTGFELSDLAIGNGSASNLVAVDALAYEVDILPDGSGDITITIAANAVVDVDNIGNSNAVQFFTRFDINSPTVEITSTESSPTTSSSFPLTIAFSEAVRDLTVEDVTVENGNLTSISPLPEYAQTIGVLGSGNGEFNYPNGIAIDASGKIYVADSKNHRIQIFHADYSYAATLGTGIAGSDNDQFKSPAGIAVDTSGKIYVVDTENHRIQIFHADYSYAATLGAGIAGSDNDQFKSPAGIAVDTSGKIYVADTENHRIQIFNADYSYSTTIGTTSSWGSSYSQFKYPMGVAIDTSGKIYVADTENHRIQIFNADYSYSTTIGTTSSWGSSYSQFKYPTGVAIDISGKIYVADTENHRIQIFNADYSYSTTIGTGIAGTGNDQFNNPHCVAVDTLGKIYVVDYSNHRVQLRTTKTYEAEVEANREGEIEIVIANNVVLDVAGNGNETGQYSILYDVNAPTVEIKDAPSIVNSVKPYTIRLTFSEVVSGLELSDLTIGNGSASNLVTADSRTYEVDIIPNGNGDITIDVAADIATDAAGKGNVASTQTRIFYDAIAPTAVITSTESSPTNSGSIPVTFTFSEPISGLRGEGITIENGSLASLYPSPEYAQTMGTGIEGSSNDQFNFSVDVGIDGLGKIYVVDIYNHRIQIFNADGSYATTIGNGKGSNNDQFYYPHAIDFDVFGNIYVSDNGNNRIQIFNTDYNYVGTVGSGTHGTDNDQFRNLFGIAIDASGKIYAADQYNNRIQIFNADGSYSSTIGSYGNGNYQFYRPSGIAIDTSGKIYIADSQNHRIQIFNADYSYAATIGTGTAGSGNDQFNSPAGIAVDALGKIYIADRKNHRIQIFNADYSYAATLGRGTFGAGNDQFNTLYGVEVDASGKIFVADSKNHRIQIFTTNTYQGVITPNIDGEITIDIATDATLDAAGNGNEATQFSIFYDNTPPTIEIQNAPNVVNSLNPYTVKLIFSEEVTGFSIEDIMIGNGSTSNLVATDAYSYEMMITPNGNGDIVIDVAADIAIDNAGNSNTATQVNTLYDPYSPSVEISSTALDTVSGVFTITISFSEIVSGFDAEGIDVTNGTITAFSTSDNQIFTAEVQPATEGHVSVAILDAAGVDAAGNTSEASYLFNTVYHIPDTSEKQNGVEEQESLDIVSPIVTISSDKSEIVQDSFIATFTFSEKVNGFKVDDILIENALASDLQTIDSLSFTAQITPTEPGEISIMIQANVVKDAAGNGNEASSTFTILNEEIVTALSNLLYKGNLSIYPVPASHNLWVSADLQKSRAVHIRLIDTCGKLLASQHVGKTIRLQERLDVKHLPTGLYFLQVQIDSATYTQKVVIGN